MSLIFVRTSDNYETRLKLVFVYSNPGMDSSYGGVVFVFIEPFYGYFIFVLLRDVQSPGFF